MAAVAPLFCRSAHQLLGQYQCAPKILSLSAAARHHLPTLAARSRQRVIRIAVLFAALHESAFGPLADILFMAVYVRFR